MGPNYENKSTKIIRLRVLLFVFIPIFLISGALALYIQKKSSQLCHEIQQQQLQDEIKLISQILHASTTEVEISRQFKSRFTQLNQLTSFFEISLVNFKGFVIAAFDEQIIGQSFQKQLSSFNIPIKWETLQSSCLQKKEFVSYYDKQKKCYYTFIAVDIDSSYLLCGCSKIDSAWGVYQNLIWTIFILYFIFVFCFACVLLFYQNHLFSQIFKIQRSLSKIPQIIGKKDISIEGTQTISLVLEQMDTMLSSFENNSIQLTQFMDAVKDIIFLTDLNGQIFGCNKAFSKFVGLSKQKLYGKELHEIMPLEYANPLMVKDRLVLKNQENLREDFSIHLTDRGNFDFDITKSPIYSMNHSLIGVLSIGREISRIKKYENTLKSMNQQIFTFLHVLNIGIVLVNTKTRTIEKVNAAACKMFHMSKENLIGHSCHPFFCATFSQTCLMKLSKDVPISHLQTELTTSDGTSFNVLISITKIKFNDVDYYLHNFVDITELKQNEEQMKEILNNTNFLNKVMMNREHRLAELENELESLSS